jgi:hypothetical protein
LGRVLGRGGFCVVNEITKINLLKRDEGSIQEKIIENQDAYQIGSRNVIQGRNFMQAQCLRGKGKDCRYAIKTTQDSRYVDDSTFINGIVDLAVEARFLSVLHHPNIIKMRAMATCSPYDSSFFVVLDRLYDTLSTRLVKWKQLKPRGLRKLLDRNGKKELALWIERCSFAYDLASALRFLHESK